MVHICDVRHLQSPVQSLEHEGNLNAAVFSPGNPTQVLTTTQNNVRIELKKKKRS